MITIVISVRLSVLKTFVGKIINVKWVRLGNSEKKIGLFN